MLSHTADDPAAGPAKPATIRILMIQEPSPMAAAVRVGLFHHGFTVDVCESGFEGEDLAGSGEYDLILLDGLLPDRPALDVCRNLQRRRISAKILVLTTARATADITAALDAGADDYMTKPFEFDELLARVRALLRRGDGLSARLLRCDDLTLDLYTRRARRGDRALDLSRTEWALLEFLMRHQESLVSRSQIRERVWGDAGAANDNLVNVYVSLLRKKVAGASGSELIHTLKGAGYRFGVADRKRRAQANGGRDHALAPAGNAPLVRPPPGIALQAPMPTSGTLVAAAS